ncbi:MAG: O-antigen ligase family protein, partial [Solirubrobacteraceae bacterium]
VALGRLAPGRWAALVGGVATAMTAVCAYALLAKVFPDTLAQGNQYGRLQAPFGYWNAVGVSGALGVAPALWAASRRSGSVLLRGLTVPAMTLMLSVVVLSYSRSAVLVAVVAIAAWIAFVPLRLRSALMLALAGLGALPIVIVALHSHNLTGDNIAISSQDVAGHAFGPVALAAVIVVAVAGVAASLAMDRVAVAEATRRRIGTVLVVGVALVPAAAVVALAASSRGLFGQISHAWQSLTSSHSVVFDNAGRITKLGSARPVYWHEGLTVGSHALLKGVGELGYGVARLRYTTSTSKADQAHSYLVQTFADLGIVGVLLTLALLAAWCRAAARPLALGARWRSLTTGEVGERGGLLALAIVVLAFGVQSALDYTFYFPGVTVPALLCAGWLAGRGPLSAPVGRRAGERVSVLQRPAAGALVTGLVALALMGAWVMWQPLRSAQAMADAENAPATAFASAQAAASRDPLSIQPLFLLSVLYRDNHNPRAAQRELLKASQLQPENPQPWLWLAQFDVAAGQSQAALTAAAQVFALNQPVDSTRLAANDVIVQAQAQIARRAARLKSQARRRTRAAGRAKHRATQPRTQP